MSASAIPWTIVPVMPVEAGQTALHGAPISTARLHRAMSTPQGPAIPPADDAAAIGGDATGIVHVAHHPAGTATVTAPGRIPAMAGVR